MSGTASIDSLNEKVKGIVEELKTSPMFRLSLSSKELFHSNFLAWLCDKDNKHNTASVMEGVLGQVFAIEHGFSIIKVDRENKNRDLVLRLFDKTNQVETNLVIEVKVKSIPSFEQMAEYSISGSANERRFLLSIIEPEALPDDWKFVHFKELINVLKESFKNHPDYAGELVADYCLFVELLIKLQSEFIDWNRAGNNFFFFVKADKSMKTPDSELRKIRLHDLIYKSHFDQLAKILSNKLDEPITVKPWKGLDGYRVEPEMTHAEGKIFVGRKIFEKLNPTLDIWMGVEVQQSSFRVFLMPSAQKKQQEISPGQLQEIANNIWRILEKGRCHDWCNLKLNPTFTKSSRAVNSKKELNKFRGGYYHSVYKHRYVRSGVNISVVELADFIVEYLNNVKIESKYLKAVCAKVVQEIL